MREADISFLTDIFHGDFGNLGNDLAHAPESLAKHPSELYETIGGAAAIATGGLALGALPELGAAGGAAGLFGGGADAAAGAGGGFAGLLGGGADAALPEASTLATGELDLGAVAPTVTDAGQIIPPGTFSAEGAGLDPATADYADTLTAPGGGAPQAATSLPGDAATGFEPQAAPGTGKGPVDAPDQSFWSKISQGAVNQVTKNPLGIAAGVGALGANVLLNKPNPNIGNLQGQANQLTQQGQQFMSYLQNGTLPPALKASVDQAANAAKARATANAAANGQSTDPTQNTQLAQELAQADMNALIAVGQLGEQLFQSGQSEINLSTQIYEKLIQIDQQQTANMGKAIAGFAAAMSGPAIKAAA